MAATAIRTISLDDPCFSREPIPPDKRQALIDSFWPPSATVCHDRDLDNVDDFEAYFNFLQQECDPVSQTSHAAQSYADLAYVLNIVKSNAAVTMSDLRQIIMNANARFRTDEPELSASIQLVVRLWLMINVRNLIPNDHVALQNALPWPDHSSLAGVLQQWTNQSQVLFQSPYSPSKEEFPDLLNVFDLKRISGYRIQWTNDLMNHLTMNGLVIYLYHHVSVLQRIRKSAAPALLPLTFVDETIATLDLLIPLTSATCNNWLRTEVNQFGLDRRIIYRKCASRRTADYVHWRTRLLAIEEVFERSKPATFSQQWHDRRDMGQWWAFWLVVTGIFLTVLFGLIQSVTGIIQVARPGSG